MSQYSPKWTSVEDINAFFQTRFTSETYPSESDVMDEIEKAEQGMLTKNLGSQTATELLVDVSLHGSIAPDTVAWYDSGKPARSRGATVILPHQPIISMTSGATYRNTASLQSAPNWDLLISKDNLPDASDADFIINYEVDPKTGKRLGDSLYFFRNIPFSGKNRLKSTWVYGHNVDTVILREYATLKACRPIAWRILTGGNPPNLVTFGGGELNSYANTSTLELQLNYIDGRMREIEEDHFPSEYPIVVMQGI